MKYVVIFENFGDETAVSIALLDRKINAKICTIIGKNFIVNEEVIIDNPEKLALEYAKFFFENILKEK